MWETISAPAEVPVRLQDEQQAEVAIVGGGILDLRDVGHDYQCLYTQSARLCGHGLYRCRVGMSVDDDISARLRVGECNRPADIAARPGDQCGPTH